MKLIKPNSKTLQNYEEAVSKYFHTDDDSMIEEARNALTIEDMEYLMKTSMKTLIFQ